MYCRHCGKEINNQSLFCANCGKKTPINPMNFVQPITTHQTVSQVRVDQSTEIQPKKLHMGFKIIISAAILLLAGAAVFIGLQFLGNNDIVQNDRILKDLGEAAFIETDIKNLMESETWGQIPNNQIFVMLDDDSDKKDAEAIALDLNGEIVGEMELIHLYQIKTSEFSEKELLLTIEGLVATSGVEAAFPNVSYRQEAIEGIACTPLKDPIFGEGDNIKPYELIGMVGAWRIIKASEVTLNNVYVGVLDRAVYTGSTEFGGRVKITGDKTTMPSMNANGTVKNGHLNHGTMVAHVIGADAEDGGMVGVASVLEDKLNIEVKNNFKSLGEAEENVEYDANNTTIVLDEDQNTYSVDDSLVHLKQLVESGQTVINCSFGPKTPGADNKWVSKAYKKFFEKVYEEHPEVVFVAAAGNEGKDPVSKGKLTSDNYWPGGIKALNLITVGAINNDGSRADFSNYAGEGEGAEVTISAPGVDMVLGIDLSAKSDDKTGTAVKASGTSFSAPQVSAAVALLQSINPKLTAKDVKEILTETAAKGVTTGAQSIPIPAGMGAGVLRVDAAVLKVINDLREEKGLDPLDLEYILNSTQVDLVAEGSDGEYTLSAWIKEATGKKADLSIEVSGDHALKGKSTQSVQVGDKAEWDITLEDESVFIKVIRLDNNSCEYLTLDPAEAERGSSEGGTGYKLIFFNEGASLEYLKQSLAENRGINQAQYALYSAPGISLDESGNFSFSGKGPGYAIQSKDDVTTTQFTENPMNIQMIGKIDLEKLEKAVNGNGDSDGTIGTASYNHTVSATRKDEFSRGNYEASEYSENAACELEIKYVEDRNCITFSSDYFDISRKGTFTSYYDGETTSEVYDESESVLIYFEFTPSK